MIHKAVTHDDVSDALHMPLALYRVFVLPTVIESKASLQESDTVRKKVYNRVDLKLKS